MSIVNPLTVNSDIARANSASNSLPMINTEIKSSYNEFNGDTVEISSLGSKRLQEDKQSQTTRKIEDVANEAISLSSTIGRIDFTGNLNHAQAKELYNKIASLL